MFTYLINPTCQGNSPLPALVPPIILVPLLVPLMPHLQGLLTGGVGRGGQDQEDERKIKP